MNGPVEPSATMRAAAKELRGIYVALVAEGFTTTEALQIVGTIIAAGIAKGDS